MVSDKYQMIPARRGEWILPFFNPLLERRVSAMSANRGSNLALAVLQMLLDLCVDSGEGATLYVVDVCHNDCLLSRCACFSSRGKCRIKVGELACFHGVRMDGDSSFSFSTIVLKRSYMCLGKDIRVPVGLVTKEERGGDKERTAKVSLKTLFILSGSCIALSGR